MCLREFFDNVDKKQDNMLRVCPWCLSVHTVNKTKKQVLDMEWRRWKIWRMNKEIRMVGFEKELRECEKIMREYKKKPKSFYWRGICLVRKAKGYDIRLIRKGKKEKLMELNKI
jgi:hypothetical protein